MRKLVAMSIGLVYFLCVAGIAQAAWDPELENKAQAAIADFKKADPSIKTFFDKAHGYAVFPTVGKGAVGVGGARGKGLVFERGRLFGDKIIGSAVMTQITVGLQLGGQAYRQVIFFEDENPLDRFKRGEIEFAAAASAVAAKKGAAAKAAYEQGVAVFTVGQEGLMVEASIGGQKFKFEPKE